MKVLIVNPPKQRNGFFISREEYGIGTIASNFLPSQVYLAAAYLRTVGIEADVVDLKSNETISFADYDVVVVWVCILHSFYDDISWLKKAKDAGRRTVMVLNEAHEGLEIEAMERYPFIDAAVRLWERELVLSELINGWERGRQLHTPGLIYREKNKLVDTGIRPPLVSSEHLTSCSSLLAEVDLAGYHSAAITPSKGCTMSHRHCLYRHSGSRRRRVEDVLEEIKAVSSGVKNILIIDPAMIDNRVWIDSFCEQLIMRELRVTWRTDARLSHCLDMELLKKLYQAGCREIMIGTPTLDAEIGRRIKARTSPEQLKRAVDNLRKVGITPIPVFEVGFPWESDETLVTLMRFLRSVPLPSAGLQQLRIWRGTPVYEECKKLGLITDDFGIDDYVDSSQTITGSAYLSPEELETWKRRIRRNSILNPMYAIRYHQEKKPMSLCQFMKAVRILVGSV